LGSRKSGCRPSIGFAVIKCHEVHSVDLARLKRNELLIPGRWSTLTWSRNGEVTGSIRILCLESALRLVYRARQSGDEWEDITETIPLIETETAFGGRRQWLSCLSCQKRCRVIYGGLKFRCRACMGLRYDTQYEPAFARSATRALKIRARLGSTDGIDAPFPDRPKGMHRTTYLRLRAEEGRLRDNWAAGILRRWGNI
jgi:hypothetical protein